MFVGSMTLWPELQDVAFTQRWVDVRGVRTRVVEAGTGAGAIVLLHGVQGHLDMWLRNIGRLSRDHRVIAFDLLGHGLTGRPDRPYEIADYLGHAIALLDALGVKSATWIGSSLGGWVSARAASAHPDRVDKLVLVSTAGLSADPAVMSRLKTLGERAAAMSGPEGVRERLKFVIHDPALVTDELVQLRWQIYSRDDYRAALKHVNALQDMTVRQRNLLTADELGRIRAPTLIVWTDHDPTASLETGRKYQALIPGARFVVLENCSHVPSWEHPEAFDRLVLECLEKGPADRPASADLLSARLAAIRMETSWTRERARQWWDVHHPARRPS
jgi:2-hydroxy-6-oxonona-2,4-dienedioate hydrolase